MAPTGALNGQAEEVVHRPRDRQSVRPAAPRSSERFDEENERAVRGELRRPVLVQPDPAVDEASSGNLQYVLIAVDRRAARSPAARSRSATCRRCCSTSRQFSSRCQQLASMSATFQSGVASAERVFELLDADEQPRPTTPARRRLARGRVVFETSRSRYGPSAVDRGPVARRRARRDRSDRRADRRRQDHARQPAACASTNSTRAGSPSTASTSRRCRGATLRSRFGMVLQDTWLFERHDPREPRGTATRTRPRSEIVRAAQVDATSTGSCTRCPTATTRSSTTRATTSSPGEKQLLTIARAFLRRPGDPDPRRGDVVGRHPHRGAGPAGDGRAARRPDVRS